MQKILSNGLWAELRKRAQKARSRKAAIAYVTSDLLGLKRGDTLVVDASHRAIQNGETDAPLLRRFQKRGVQLYSCLHAKILLIDDVGVVSSGNMSSNSAHRLVEAGLLSDHRSVVASIASLIEQLVLQSSPPLSKARIAALCKLEVIRRGRWHGRSKTRITKLGNRTWIVGIRELKKDAPPTEQKLIDNAMRSLRENEHEDDLAWIKWGTRDSFARNCRAGDSLIQVWRSSEASRPSAVYRSAPVLLKQSTKNWIRFYIPESQARNSEMGWGQFQRMLRQLGYRRRVSARTVHLVEPDMADAIDRKWNSAVRL